MFGFRFWGLSALFTLGAALLIGIPTVMIPNHFFSRVTPTSPQDYVIWGISIVLLGVTLFLRVRVLRYGCPVNFNANARLP